MTTGVNLRTGPSIGDDRISVIPRGTAVEVQECTGGWCEVSVDGRRGFVSEDYVDTGVAAAPAPDADEALAGEELAGEGLAGETTTALEFPDEGMARTTSGLNQQSFALAPLPHEQDVAQVLSEIRTQDEPRIQNETRSQIETRTDARATSDVNLRAGAGMEHSPIGVIPQGAAVEIHDCIPGRVWCEVSYGGMTGYASELYLDLS